MITETLDDFFSEVEFAVSVEDTNGAEFDAIFDTPAATKDVYSGEIINAAPKITCKTIDVDDYEPGERLVIDDTNYWVRANLPDGTGVSEVHLTMERP